MKSRRSIDILASVLTLAFVACSNGSQGSAPLPGGSTGVESRRSDGVARSTGVTPVNPGLAVPAGFVADVIANVPGARELGVARNGDLLVGTKGQTVALVTNADGAGAPGAPRTLITMPEGPAAGIAIGPNASLYVGTQTAVWKVHYAPGDLSESNPVRIAAVRTGAVAPNSDGDLHHTTSVAVLWTTVYAGVGSSCNACTEVDPTRAAILQMGLNGEHPGVYAKNVRNAMALTFNPQTYFLWAGGAGQDNLPAGHPYEYFDAITEKPAGSSWGWPNCEENRVAYTRGADCSTVVIPHVELPAYSTIVGAVFYPRTASGPYAFPAGYRGGLFLAAHGSWHTNSSGRPAVAPQVDYVPMNSSGWDAQTPPDWSDPTAQFRPFFSGFVETPNQATSGRPTGIATGPNGSLFVGDDLTGNIYRIRYAAGS